MKEIVRLKEMFKEHVEPYKKDSFWLVAYSGGKDSTIMVDFVLKFLKEEKLNIPVYIMITRVKSEYPMYEKYLDKALVNIKKYIKEEKLDNVKVIENTTATSKRFILSVIGKGYPVPRNNMRWCTLQMKLKPARNFEEKLIERHSGLTPVKIIGTRKEEGTIRAKRIEKNNHQIIDGFCSVMPIQDFTLQDVWNYAKEELSINREDLFRLYGNVTMDENNSIRQGCWFCPLVTKDMFLKERYPKLEEFRKMLKEHMIKEGIRYSVDRTFNRENVSGFLKTSVRKKFFNVFADALEEYKDEAEFFLPFSEFILTQKHMFLDGGDYTFELSKRYADITENVLLKKEAEEIGKDKNIYEIIRKATESIFDISVEEAAEGVAKKIILGLRGEEEETEIRETENKYAVYVKDQGIKFEVFKNVSTDSFEESQKKIIKKISKKQTKSPIKKLLNEYKILVLKNYFKYINDKKRS